MATFEISAPTGEKYQVDATDENAAVEAVKTLHTQPSATPAAAPPAVPGPFGQPVAPPAPAAPAPGAFGIIDQAARADRSREINGFNRPQTTPVGGIDPLTGQVAERPFEFGRTGVSAVEGLNHGAAQLLMSPLILGTAAAQGGAKMLGLPPPRDIPAELYAKLLERDPVQSENAWERGAERMGNQTMTAAPLAPMTGLMGAVKPFIPEATSGSLASAFVPANMRNAAAVAANTAAQSPKMATAVDAVANAASGAGAEAGKELSGGNPWWEMFGAGAGGMTPALWAKISPTALLAKLGVKVGSKALGMVPGGEEQTARLAARNDWANPEVPDLTKPAKRAGPPPVNPDQGWLTNLIQGAMDKGAVGRQADLRNGISDIVGKLAENPIVAGNLDRAKQLAEEIPGFQPTLGAASGARPLINKESQLGSDAVGSELAGMIGRRTANANAIGEFADKAVPAVPGGADEKLINLLTSQAGVADRGAAQSSADIQNRIVDLTRGLPRVESDVTGVAIRGANDTAERAMNAEVGARRAAIDPEGTFREPTTHLYNGIVGRLNNLGTDLTNVVIPPKVREILSNVRPQILGPEGTPVRVTPTYDINSLLTAREQVGVKLRQLQAGNTPESMSGADTLRGVRDAIDAEVARISQPGAGGGAPQITQQPRALETTVGGRPEAIAPGLPATAEQPSTVQSRLADFNQFYREQYVPRFRQDLGAKMSKNAPSGAEAIKTEDIPTTILNPNSITEMRQFNLTHAPGSPARQALADHALDDIRRRFVKNGQIDEAGVQSYLKERSRVLDEAPDLRSAIAARDPSPLYKQLAKAEEARQGVADEHLTKQLGGQPHELVDAGLKDPRVMTQIANNARSAGPEATAALQRAVWERAIGSGTADPAKIQAFLTGNAKSLAPVFTPQHMADLQTIMDAAAIEGRVPVPKGSAEMPPTADSKLKQLTGQGLPAWISKITRMTSGMVGEKYTAAEAAMRVLNQYTNAEATKIAKEAFFNPDLAATMAVIARSGKATPMQRQRLSSFLAFMPGDAKDNRPTDDPFTVRLEKSDLPKKRP